MIPEDIKIDVIALGYVGLPLAVEFGKQFNTLGFDINAQQIVELLSGRIDPVSSGRMALASARRQRQ